MILRLRFGVHLEDFGGEHFDRPHGPLFHRWLPNGRADELSVPTADSRNRITAWFERRGFVDGSFIRYDMDRCEVDESTMRRQARLDAGALRGEAEFAHVTSDELAAIREGRIGSKEYVAAGKRIVAFLYQPIAALVDLLRVQYGQYWLPEILPWDSRAQSLGSYCSSTFSLRWRETENEDWHKFQPTDLSMTVFAQLPPGRAYEEYLTENDWRRIQSSFSPTSTLPLALRVIARAHQLHDSGHVNESFVQAVTGLELSIEYFVANSALRLSKDVAAFANQLLTLPLKVQLSILATATSRIPVATIDTAIDAIDLRNKIVHEGSTGEDERRRMFLAIAECARVFLGLTEFKTPVLNSGNQLSAPE